MPALASKHLCTGCSACASVCPKGCIQMTGDAYGFRFPEVDGTVCISCGRCENVCPVLTPPEADGKSPATFAAYSKCDMLRRNSSSGGIFSELAREILNRKGAVFGAAYTEQFDVVHICAEDEAGLASLRGAKYAQSNLGSTFAEVKDRLERGQQVLFSGTPCQVAGLNAFLRKSHENLTTVDFVCHGVPSPMAWREYLRFRAEQDNGGVPPRSVNLRSKESGWSRYRYCNLFQYENDITHAEQSSESLFMNLFVGDYLSRESCANCRFKGCRRVSDLTIGDFWGIWDIAPEMDDDRGTSLVLVQSDKGRALWEQIADRLVTKEVTPEQAALQNPSLLRSSPPNPQRQEVLDQIRRGKIAGCEAFLAPQRRSTLHRIRARVQRILQKLAESR